MSQETQAWAKQQRTGDPITRAVLMELCNWARPTGIVDFRSYDDIAFTVEVSRRTVIRHIDRLENELQLIRRVVRHREDGGRGANGFELVGFSPALAPAKGSSKAARKVPVTLCHPPSDTQTPPGDAIVTPPGDTAVTLLGDKIIPLSSPDGEDAPHDGLKVDFDSSGDGADVQAALPAAAQATTMPKPTRLSADWTPPLASALPPKARGLVATWPDGAYAVVGEAFGEHFRSASGSNASKRNWDGAFAVWCIREHGKIMRDAKAGVLFGGKASSAAGAAAPARRIAPVNARSLEDERSKAMHGALRDDLGGQIYDQWIKHVALLCRDDRVIVVCPSQFVSDWISQRFGPAIVRAGLRAGMARDAASSHSFEIEHGDTQ